MLVLVITDSGMDSASPWPEAAAQDLATVNQEETFAVGVGRSSLAGESTPWKPTCDSV